MKARPAAPFGPGTEDAGGGLVSAPLLPLALALAAGVWLGLQTAPPPWIVPLGLAATGLVLLGTRGRPAVASSGALALALLAGWARVPLPDPWPAVQGITPGRAVLEGLVGGPPELDGPRLRVPLVLRQAGEPPRPAAGTITLSVYGAAPHLVPGDHIRVHGTVIVSARFRNPGAEAEPPRNRRHAVTAQGAGVTQLAPVPAPWWLRTRLWVHDVVSAHLPPVSGALLEGLLIGERRQLPPTLLADFRRAGVLHVLAISGFNVGLVAGAAFLLFRLVRLPRAAAAFLALGTLLGFAAVVGGQPSVLRATVMGGLFLAAGLLGRESHAWNSLAAALIVLLALDPGSLAEPGFQLSFAATAGLLHLGPWLRARMPAWCPRRLADALAISAGAQLGVTPVLLAYWGQLAPLGVVANLFVVPLAAVLTTGGLLALVLTLPSEGVAHLLFQSLWCLLVLLRASVRALARVPATVIQVAVPPTGALLAGTLALVLAPLVRGGATVAVAILGLGAALAVAAAGRPDGLARVLVLDVGQGEAILVRAPDGQALLVDTGGGGPGLGDRGAYAVVPALRRLGIDRLRALALTSRAPGHGGGLLGILEGVAVDELWVPAGTALPLLEPPDAEPTLPPVRTLARGDRRWLGPLLLTVLHPPAGAAPRAGPLVLRLDWGLFTAVLASDATAQDEVTMLASGVPLPAAVLKVAGHGSRRASSAPFVAAVGPRIAVIPVGRNPFGHPSPVVVGRLAAAGAVVYRTDRDGAVELVSDGARLWIRAWGRPTLAAELPLRGGP